MLKWTLGVFAAIITLSAQVKAAGLAEYGSADGRQEVSINLGSFHPTARFGISGLTGDRAERFGSTGFLFTADYFHSVTRMLALGIEGMYINRGGYKVHNLSLASLFNGASTDVRGNTKAILAMSRLSFPWGGVRPYVAGGVGIQNTSMDLFMKSPPGTFWGAGFGDEITVVRSSVSGIIGVVRGGVEKSFASGGTLGLEAGWVRIPAGRFVRTPVGQSYLQNDIVTSGDGLSLAVKFGYRFGGGY